MTRSVRPEWEHGLALSERITQRFWSRVNKDGAIPETNPALGSCWLWLRGTNNYGYGTFCITATKKVTTHVLAYLLEIGPIADGYELDHLCRVPACVRPSHLEPVPHRVNVQRGQVGLMNGGQPLCPRGHAYSETLYIEPATGYRRCGICKRENQRSCIERRSA